MSFVPTASSCTIGHREGPISFVRYPVKAAIAGQFSAVAEP